MTLAAQATASRGAPVTEPARGHRPGGEPHRCDLLVLGGGAAGIAAARAGARRGVQTVLVQEGRIGGECTFTGCVPSKTLIEAAGQGLSFAQAVTRMRAAIETIAAAESAEVLAAEGIDVVSGRGNFTGPRTVTVGGQSIRARRAVIATGSRPQVPPIDGLPHVSFLTNESVFDLTDLPSSVAILGGGAVGCELAQALRRFGAEVHLVEAQRRLLPKEEPEASAVLADVFTREGVVVHLGTRATRADQSVPGGPIRLLLEGGGDVRAAALVVAVGRQPNGADLHPLAAGVELDGRGHVRTDGYLRTTARGVYAAGDVTGKMLFTHAADEMGRLAVHNAFGHLRRRRFDLSVVPWVTFCDPEVARVGMDEHTAAAHGGRVATLPMAAVDRAVIADRTEGFVKLLAGPRPMLGSLGGGKLLGGTIVAPRAGELVHEIALGMQANVFAGRLAQTVHAYPTWSTAVRQAAAQLFMEVDGRQARAAQRTRPD